MTTKVHILSCGGVFIAIKLLGVVKYVAKMCQEAKSVPETGMVFDNMKDGVRNA